ncbi:MAG: hypothetical protein LBR07_08770 [Puniceicoccales bacterium]|jgi:hypothetical protein|nr:hypothetical protein [Puniceicoccales bacterium]
MSPSAVRVLVLAAGIVAGAVFAGCRAKVQFFGGQPPPVATWQPLKTFIVAGRNGATTEDSPPVLLESIRLGVRETLRAKGYVEAVEGGPVADFSVQFSVRREDVVAGDAREGGGRADSLSLTFYARNGRALWRPSAGTVSTGTGLTPENALALVRQMLAPLPARPTAPATP